MKSFLKSLLLLLIANESFAQITFRGYYYYPANNFGTYMKPAISAEIGFTPDFKEKNSRARVSITYLKLQPKYKLFNAYTLKTLSFAETRSYRSYEIFQLFAGWDFAILKKERFQLYLGPDIICGIVNDKHTDLKNDGRLEQPENEYTIGMMGVRHRIGAQYKVHNHINLFLNVQTCGWIKANELFELDMANDVGIGIQYIFKRNKK